MGKDKARSDQVSMSRDSLGGGTRGKAAAAKDLSNDWRWERKPQFGHTQSAWSGTPSAAGRTSSSLSSPQKVLLRLGAGVTGRLGRSMAVGKSVRSKLSRRLRTLSTSSAGSGSLVGDRMCWSCVGEVFSAFGGLPRFFCQLEKART